MRINRKRWGCVTNDSANKMALDDFKTMVDENIAWAKENGFTDDVFVYPGGLFLNSSTDVDAKLEYLKTKNIKMAYSCNNPCESSSKEGFEEWNTYENGADYHGLYNKFPFVTMPNGYNHALMLNRNEVGKNNLTVKWWKESLDNAIAKKAHICFFTHSFTSGFRTADDNGKTYADYFKELIEYIVTTYGDQVEWVTPSQLKNR